MSDDPWLWSVDELVAQLCQSRALFEATGHTQTNCPPALEAQLREHNFTGAIFLTGVNDKVLCQQLGTRTPEQKLALLAIVRHLRSRSVRHSQHIGTSETQSVGIQSAATFLSPYTATNPNGAVACDDGGRKKVKRAPLDTNPIPPPGYEASPTFDVTLSRSRLVTASQGLGESHGGTVGEWDYLLHRNYDSEDYPSERSLDSLGDDGEDEEDPDDGGENEKDEEGILDNEPLEPELAQGQKPRNRLLSDEQKVLIVQEEIDRLTFATYPGKNRDDHYDQAYDEYELWQEFVVLPTEEKKRVIEATQENIKQWGYKLDKLCKEIVDGEWRSDRAIRQQCASLEMTIDFLEQEKWEFNVYQLRSPPGKNGFDNIDRILQPTSTRIPATSRADRNNDSNDTEMTDIEYGRQNKGTVHQDMAGSHVDRTTMSAIEAIDLPDSASEASRSEPELEARRPSNRLLSNNGRVQTHSYRHADQIPAPNGGTGTPKSMVIDAVRPELNASQRPSQIPQPVDLTPPPTQPSVRPNESPEDASIATVRKWNWEDLVDKKDRKRMIMKTLLQMSTQDREALRARLHTVRKRSLMLEIQACVAMFIRDENKLQGVLPRDLPKIVLFTKLFLNWWLAEDYVNGTKMATKEGLEELAQCLEAGSRDPEIFFNWVLYVMDHTFSKEALEKPSTPNQAEVIVISDDDEPVVSKSLPSSQTKSRHKIWPVRK